LPELASNLDPLDLYLLSTEDYRCEPGYAFILSWETTTKRTGHRRPKERNNVLYLFFPEVLGMKPRNSHMVKHILFPLSYIPRLLMSF
jgi:hypothetical protein